MWIKILRDKQTKEIILRTAANYLIAIDALNKANESDMISVEQYADAMQHVTDNSIEIANMVGGLKGIIMINDIVKSKTNKLRLHYGTKDRRDI